MINLAVTTKDVVGKLDYTVGNQYKTGNYDLLPLQVNTLLATIIAILVIGGFGLIIYAGYLWMTAQGDSEQVDKAKKIMIYGAIGLVILSLAYPAVGYIFSLLCTGKACES